MGFCNYCKYKLDYLPFRCRRCSFLYCSNCRLPENHKCFGTHKGSLTHPHQSATERAVLKKLNEMGLFPKEQFPFDQLTLDIAFPEQKIDIEIDGPNHNNRQAADGRRDYVMQSRGWTVKRFSANEAYNNPDKVAEQILDLLNQVMSEQGVRQVHYEKESMPSYTYVPHTSRQHNYYGKSYGGRRRSRSRRHYRSWRHNRQHHQRSYVNWNRPPVHPLRRMWGIIYYCAALITASLPVLGLSFVFKVPVLQDIANFAFLSLGETYALAFVISVVILLIGKSVAVPPLSDLF